ncbi:MAG: N-acyl homoserine lactonase family protein [Actinobacteria bacterium]|nr:N-acyl homoserine lactonase family protein [Actinomycetota bacterium]
MGPRALYLLGAGYLDIDKSVFLAGIEPGTRLRAPVYCGLILTDEGYILVDTGLNPAGIEDPASAWGPRAREAPPIMTPEDDTRHRLRELGVKPEEIKWVIHTHLHWDHTGGNRFFTRARFVVQKSEYLCAWDPPAGFEKFYMSNHFKHPLDYWPIEGDLELLPGIRLLSTPGHTVGHQSVVVELPQSGPMILAGDAVYLEENIRRVVPPGNCWSAEASVNSLERLRRISSGGKAVVLPGHDPDWWKGARKPPLFYD